ncbi:MAG: cytochrome biogenesis protein [Alteromonadaceae bacterium]|nr:cytochrome biogenesis protein [Alteromonadaceae bacterium]MBH85568.1 cytochrome biogenesis protein [Alteromonadaceae bacterium]|tara:strand:+ start:7649 stop:8341 length:693 start_codon:yes stop_codon:yes gene_type:complete
MGSELYLSYSGAFMIGLLGSTHCLGMCGGISASLSMAIPVGQNFRARQSLMLLGFNAGRIGSYMLIAALIALISTHAVDTWAQLGTALRSVAGLLLILMGLAMGQWWQGIRYIERVGGPLWRRLAPLTQCLMPVQRPYQALLLGMLWGWLPCGLIYSTLGWAALQPTVPAATMTMLFFGLGTLPSMLATGFAATSLQRLKSNRYFRQITGALLIAFGLWTLPFLHIPQLT